MLMLSYVNIDWNMWLRGTNLSMWIQSYSLSATETMDKCCIHILEMIGCAIIAVLCLQDEDASYDVNGHDPDPQPRYDHSNENRLAFYVAFIQITALCIAFYFYFGIDSEKYICYFWE